MVGYSRILGVHESWSKDTLGSFFWEWFKRRELKSMRYLPLIVSWSLWTTINFSYI
jgi:hypothetical protein